MLFFRRGRNKAFSLRGSLVVGCSDFKVARISQHCCVGWQNRSVVHDRGLVGHNHPQMFVLKTVYSEYLVLTLNEMQTSDQSTQCAVSLVSHSAP